MTTSPLAAAADHAGMRTPIEGPVDAELVSIIDGDTLLVDARPWPQQRVTVLVRLRGVDAPELRTKCAKGREAALRAKALLGALTRGRLRLSNITGDKYFGRVVADVSVQGRDLGASLLARGVVRPYDGGTKAAVC